MVDIGQNIYLVFVLAKERARDHVVHYMLSREQFYTVVRAIICCEETLTYTLL